MADQKIDLSLSRTFKIVDGRLDLDQSSEQALSWYSGTGSDSEAAQASARLIGTVVDSKYRVLALLGEGGMGSVYRVLHLLLNKEMALKTFRTAQLAPDAWGRFQREAQAIAKLTQANIVQVFDFGIVGQAFPFYTMELLEGESLADRLEREGRLTIEEALRIFAAVAAGMAHAHRQGIVHRDIKPANIFMESGKITSTPKIVDFGLAKLATNQSPENQGLTSAGLVFGSPLYMSPEQSMGLDTDQRTDIYSFGCSLFQALTGQPPFVGKNALATIMMHQQEMPPRLVRRAEDVVFPARLEAIIARLLAKDVKKRYQTFEEVGQDLAAVDLSVIKTLTGARGESTVERPDEGAEEELASAGNSLISARNLLAAGGVLILFGIAAVAIIAVGQFGAGPEKSRIPRSRALESPFQLSEGANASGGISRGAVIKARNFGIPKSRDELTDSAAFSEKEISRKTPDGGKLFDFPANVKGIGLWSEDGNAYTPVTGPIALTPGRKLFFRAGQRFSDSPELFRRFAADDLDGLQFDRACTWSTRHLVEVSRLKSIKHLHVGNFNLVVTDLQYINQLPDLVHLQVSGCGLTGHDLFQLSCLTRLENLEADYLTQMTPLIIRLKQGQVHNLSLKSCDLNDDDMKQLGAVSSLFCLCIDKNKFSSRAVQYLSPLPGLNTLRMGSCENVGPDVVEALSSGFKKLVRVRITTDGWTPEQKAALTRTLQPGCLQEPPG